MTDRYRRLSHRGRRAAATRQSRHGELGRACFSVDVEAIEEAEEVPPAPPPRPLQRPPAPGRAWPRARRPTWHAAQGNRPSQAVEFPGLSSHPVRPIWPVWKEDRCADASPF